MPNQMFLGGRNFCLKIYFRQKGTRLTSDDMELGNINFIGAIDNNNCVREKNGN